jgi:hypothetical protein
MVAALVVAKLVNGKTAAQIRTTTSPTTSTTSAVVKVPKNPVVDPAFELHPQRARAGPPIQLELRGSGCAGGMGDVTITEVGTALQVPVVERLVLRTRFDIDAAGNWSTSPLLVEQPAGNYRVSAACSRRAVAADLVPPVQRRDVFVATEMLELTAPTLEERFEVDPAKPPVHVAVTVVAQGFQRCPAGAQVSGQVVPTFGTRAHPRDFSVTVGPDTRWRVSLPFSSTDAVGTYSISANCSSGFAFGNQVVEFS